MVGGTEFFKVACEKIQKMSGRPLVSEYTFSVLSYSAIDSTRSKGFTTQ